MMAGSKWCKLSTLFLFASSILTPAWFNYLTKFINEVLTQLEDETIDSWPTTAHAQLELLQKPYTWLMCLLLIFVTTLHVHVLNLK